MIKESIEFVDLQKELLRHKFLYYIENKPEISDYDYDKLERKSFAMAKELGFRADSWEGATPEEIFHVHFMVAYNENSPYNV